jgi:hypothetical protein
MLRVDSCCFCYKLETGGKFWGCFGAIGGFFSIIPISAAAIECFKCCEFGLVGIEKLVNFLFVAANVLGYFFVFVGTLSVLNIIASFFLIQGISDVNRQSIYEASS